jgi:hypothetical protein
VSKMSEVELQQWSGRDETQRDDDALAPLDRLQTVVHVDIKLLGFSGDGHNSLMMEEAEMGRYLKAIGAEVPLFTEAHAGGGPKNLSFTSKCAPLAHCIPGTTEFVSVTVARCAAHRSVVLLAGTTTVSCGAVSRSPPRSSTRSRHSSRTAARSRPTRSTRRPTASFRCALLRPSAASAHRPCRASNSQAGPVERAAVLFARPAGVCAHLSASATAASPGGL